MMNDLQAERDKLYNLVREWTMMATIAADPKPGYQMDKRKLWEESSRALREMDPPTKLYDILFEYNSLPAYTPIAAIVDLADILENGGPWEFSVKSRDGKEDVAVYVRFDKVRIQHSGDAINVFVEDRR